MRRSRYSVSSSSASARRRSDSSMLLLTFSARSSRAWVIRGNANFDSTHIVTMNASSVQTISPIPG
ncbi:MAG: hypothetical protein R2691_06570 [Solirubrobacterales bacterium]